MGGYNYLLQAIDSKLHDKVKHNSRIRSNRRTLYFIKEYPELFNINDFYNKKIKKRK